MCVRSDLNDVMWGVFMWLTATHTEHGDQHTHDTCTPHHAIWILQDIIRNKTTENRRRKHSIIQKDIWHNSSFQLISSQTQKSRWSLNIHRRKSTQTQREKMKTHSSLNVILQTYGERVFEQEHKTLMCACVSQCEVHRNTDNITRTLPLTCHIHLNTYTTRHDTSQYSSDLTDNNHSSLLMKGSIKLSRLIKPLGVQHEDFLKKFNSWWRRFEHPPHTSQHLYTTPLDPSHDNRINSVF